jgi:AraC-like DNA-binding protein
MVPKQRNRLPRAARELVRRYEYLPDKVRPVHRSALLADYAAAPFEGPSPYEHVESLTFLGHEFHYSVQYAPHYARGRGEFCGFGDGFFIWFGECEFESLLELSVTAPDMVRIRIGDKGRGEYVASEQERARFDGPCTLVVIEPAGSPAGRCAIEGPNRSLQLYLTRDVLGRLYAGDEANLPSVLQAFVAGTLDHAAVRRLPLSPTLLRCLDDLLSCDCEGRTRRHYIQSKAMEIFCNVFDALGVEDGFGSHEASALTSRGVLKAQSILMKNFVSPPSLDDLAREVGLSRTALTAGFRAIVKRSVFGYIQELRMQHALTLLQEPGSSITQVAFAVGYTHVSSFSVAVQRRLGVTPRDLRRRVLDGLRRHD